MSTAVTDWNLGHTRTHGPNLGGGRIPEGLSTAATEWNRDHAHPHGSWWQYRNDPKVGERTIIALAVMAVISVLLTVWVVMSA